MLCAHAGLRLEIHCRGDHCNATHADTMPGASFGTFNQASEQLDAFYNNDLAQHVNSWAADDCESLAPWQPAN